MRRLPHVTWLRSFEAAARHSSFSAAADELALTPAAVSQQIRQLEHHLGIQLFKRLPKGVQLTDIGQAYAQPVRKSFVEMQAATDGLFRLQRKSVVRVRCSISFAALILAPLLRDFARIHPNIDVELSTAVWSDRIDGARSRSGYPVWRGRLARTDHPSDPRRTLCPCLSSPVCANLGRQTLR